MAAPAAGCVPANIFSSALISPAAINFLSINSFNSGNIAERVASLGASFFPFAHPGDAGLGPLWAKLRTIPEAERARVVIGEIFAGASAAAALPGLMETVERFAPSIIVRESQEYAAVVVGGKLGIPHVRVAITAASRDAELLSYALPFLETHREQLGAAPDPTGARIASGHRRS